MSFVILFSMYDPDASNTTLFAFLTIFAFPTWKVTFLNCAASAVDMMSYFAPSFSTMLPSAVQNTPHLDPSDSTVL